MIVRQLNLLPDEGVCIEVLHTAARHGLPDLASEVIEVLKLVAANLQEHHFAALVEARCRAGKVEDAILTLDDMRSQDIKPLPATASAITTVVGTDIGSLDAALSTTDDMQKQGKRIDVEALNAIVQAATSLGDLQRAIGVYKAFGDYGADPTVDTFNLLLASCTASCHRELGNRLIAEMKQAKLVPNTRTYENIIALCLTQEIYEDAFFYLEEMKAAKHVPPSTIYRSLAQKCLLTGDSRYKLVLEEMEQCGYRAPAEESRRSRTSTAPKDQ
jgi:pentatricopeptide repeat protein